MARNNGSNGSMVVSNDVMCRRCGGSGVNNRLGGQNCIACRGKGFMNVEDQMREQMFQKAQEAKGLVQRFDNMKRLSPNLFEASMKSNPDLKNKIDEAKLVLHEYEKSRAAVASAKF